MNSVNDQIELGSGSSLIRHACEDHDMRNQLKHVQTFLQKLWDKRCVMEDGRGIGCGDHFIPNKFIKRTFKRWVNSTKQLLNAGRGHQAPRKAAHCLQKQVGKNIKEKKRDKRGREGAPSWEGSLKKREVSKHQETFSLPSLWWALEAKRQHNREEK